jgi:predicted DsbA family dithiol-disulfide isomerase
MHVEIWSDIACPWCYVGKRRFEAALAAFEHRDEVTVTWRSFELDPEAPPEREGERAVHLAEKYGTTRGRAIEMQDHMARVAAEDGLDFRFDIARDANTFDAHRLVHLAAAHGSQDAMKERLFRAHLTEGELISEHATLERLAADVGVPAEEARDALATGRYADEVREDEHLAARIGITAVPFFVVDRAIGVSGAQPPDVLGELLRRGRERRSPAVTVMADGESCGVDGC